MRAGDVSKKQPQRVVTPGLLAARPLPPEPLASPASYSKTEDTRGRPFLGRAAVCHQQTQTESLPRNDFFPVVSPPVREAAKVFSLVLIVGSQGPHLCTEHMGA